MKIIPHVCAALLLTFSMTSAAFGQHAGHTGHGSTQSGSTLPTERGDATFAAIAEIVQILGQDPETDWSRVDIDALRTHLVDMSVLTSSATVLTDVTPNGIEMQVSRSGRAGEAASRMVPAHGTVLAAETGWTSEVHLSDEAITWTVTAQTEAQAQQIKALGFFGLMATGDHHRAHHIALAKGSPSH
ncbi:hypothetical protein [uncultured Sulfitobacter sp.]|uniref:hypothetical protein n=1 Tax=uncultured Sulfitobacter sp. TaxID=191468 RepID=UPI0026396A2C|nr:hypothetical protein [uncultured Sulfitobacter sp.]